MKRFGLIVILVQAMIPIAGPSFAADAEVLRKGLVKTSVSYTHTFPIDQRFNPDGNPENPGIDFNANLNSVVFPALRLVELGFGMPAGTASVGRSAVSFEYRIDYLNLAVEYGITDKLMAGVYVPYVWAENRVDASLNTSSATVGKNAALNTLSPLALPGTVPLTKEDVLNLLGPGLRVGTTFIPGFGFKPFETWSGEGFGDIEAGFKYQYYKSGNWKLAALAGARFPTGEEDDPDNLVDYGIGGGAYALLFRMNSDFVGIRNLVLDAALRYNLVLPEKVEKRVPTDVNQPITTNKENVSRNIGDVREIEVSAKYRFTEALNALALYKYGSKQKDKVSGDRGLNYSSLELETDYTEHVYALRLSYSTAELYRGKKFPIPIEASLGYVNRFKGTNNVFKMDSLTLGVGVAF